jgi:hypothetical protein
VRFNALRKCVPSEPAIRSRPAILSTSVLEPHSKLKRKWPLVPDERRAPRSTGQAWDSSGDVRTQQAVLRTTTQDAAFWINLPLTQHTQSQYQQSIPSACQAVQSNPRSPKARNNIAADSEEIHHWDACHRRRSVAISLKLKFQLTKSNLAWSLSRRAARKYCHRHRRSPIDPSPSTY